MMFNQPYKLCFSNHTKRAILLSLVGFVLLSQTSWAMKGDTKQPISVLSDEQTVNMKTSTATFTKNVSMEQGAIKMQADKVVVVRAQKDSGGPQTLDAIGSPVHFQQTLDNGKTVYGEANKLHYDLNQEIVTLVGKAKLRQQDSEIQGEKIVYDVKNEQLRANGAPKKRVRTILIPAQLNANSPAIETQFDSSAPLTRAKPFTELPPKSSNQ